MSGEMRSNAVVETSLAILERARVDVEEAESRLEAVLADLRVAPRAEKTAVSSAIESALERLRHARVKLASAETTLASENPVRR